MSEPFYVDVNSLPGFEWQLPLEKFGPRGKLTSGPIGFKNAIRVAVERELGQKDGDPASLEQALQVLDILNKFVTSRTLATLPATVAEFKQRLAEMNKKPAKRTTL